MTSSRRKGPATHSLNARKDRISVYTVCRIMGKHAIARGANIKPVTDLQVDDKWPNIDGYVELTDYRGKPFGKMEIQVKFLPKKNRKRPKKACGSRFLLYCRDVAQLPVMFLAVDISSDVAHWLHISPEFVEGLGDRLNQESVQLEFPSENIISLENRSYLEDWRLISERRCEALRKYGAYSRIAELATPALGRRGHDIGQLQRFVDELNQQTEEKFLVVKNRFVRNCWKIGIAYSEYKDSTINYVLYGVPRGYNDLLVKEITPEVAQKLDTEGMLFTRCDNHNPIAGDPEGYARSLISNIVVDIVNERRLDHSGSSFLASEVISSVMEILMMSAREPPSKGYALSKVWEMCKRYMTPYGPHAISNPRDPRVVEYMRTGRDPRPTRHEEPRPMLERLKDTANRHQRSNVPLTVSIRDWIQNGLSFEWVIPGSWLPFGLFVESFEYLKGRGETEVNAPYRFPLPSPKSYMPRAYESWSAEDIEDDVRTFLRNFPLVFERLVANNFPGISSYVSRFKNRQTFIVYTLDVKTGRSCSESKGRYGIFATDEGAKAEIKLIRGDESPGAAEALKRLENPTASRDFSFEGQTCQLVRGGGVNVSTFAAQAPVLTMAYDQIIFELEGYFQTEMGPITRYKNFKNPSDALL